MIDVLAQPATVVAPLLLGGILRVGDAALRITEVEAYLGESDPGSHAFRGPGRRNAVMYGPPGHLYAYFTYGMHVCANIVCSPEGEASAVLLRAGEVIAGAQDARARRLTSKRDTDLAQGPARLCVALGITLDDNGARLPSTRSRAGRFGLELPEHPAAHQQGPRTGVSGPGGSPDYPWRFWIPGDPTVSPYKVHVPKRRTP